VLPMDTTGMEVPVGSPDLAKRKQAWVAVSSEEVRAWATGGRMELWNIGILPQQYMESQTRRSQLIYASVKTSNLTSE